MTEMIRFEFRYNGHVVTGQGRVVRTEFRGPVIVDAETGAELLVPWKHVIREPGSRPAQFKQNTLFGDE